MKLWEIAGWLLMLMGLYIFYECFTMLVIDDPPRFVQSIPLVTIGVVVFRGGLHLLKVAAAAQTCRLMQALPAEVKAPSPVSRPLAGNAGTIPQPLKR